MAGICDTCQRNQDCRRPLDGMGTCRLYISGKKSNYEQLFGTPERVAQTLLDACVMDTCNKYDESACIWCKINPFIGYVTNYNALLEWLNQEVDA